MEAQAVLAGKPFARAEEKFEELKLRLSSRESLEMRHSDLERMLESEGRELLRRLYQDYLDVRGPGPVEAPVVGSDGIERTHGRLHSRQLMSLFGEVKVDRLGYGAREVTSLHPLDAALNLPDEKYSLEVRRRVAEFVAKNSYDEAVDALAKTTGAPVPKRQVEQLAARAARDFDAFYQARQVSPDPEASRSTGELVIITADGKGVAMRTEDLREETKKAAEERQHKLSKRLSKGEKKNAKRMATVAAVYTIAPFIRTPEDIVKELSPIKGVGAERPHPENKRVWASLEKPPEEVIEEAMHEALQRDPCLLKKWVALVDGNPAQLRTVGELAKEHGVQIRVVLDLVHVLEYLWKASYAFNPEGTAQAEAWVTERLLQILQGRSSHVAAGIRRSATLRRLDGEARKAADECANYLLKYSAYLRYDIYLAEGLPISTGVIEGACRYLVKDRMDITGARWSLQGGEAVLKLRSLRASRDFEEYWSFHEAQELKRNHEAQYANGLPPPCSIPGRRASHLHLVK
jgi:hypothetical protein